MLNIFKNLNKEAEDYMEFYDDLEKAYSIAKEAHKGQLRDEGTPYITHIDGVIDILKNELGFNVDTMLAVAALHDVLEDSKYTYEDLEKSMGKTITKAVKVLTKEKGHDFGEYMKNIAENENGSWTLIVKLADRLHNLRNLKLTKNPEKIKRKCEETKKYILDYAKSNNYIYNEMLKSLNELERLY